MKTFYDVKKYVEVYNETNTSFAKKRAEVLSDFILHNQLNVNSVLDLGSGTGIFLDLTQKELKYDFGVGLDFSKKMIEFSKANIKNKKLKFIYGDMTNFNLDEKFDLVTCNYDAINHLSEFEEWKKTFENAYNYLNQKGVFAFDFNTVLKFKNKNGCSYSHNKDYDMVSKVSSGNNMINFCHVLYIKTKDGFYERVENSVFEKTFDCKMIKKALINVGFSKVVFCDENYKKINPKKVKRAFVLAYK